VSFLKRGALQPAAEQRMSPGVGTHQQNPAMCHGQKFDLPKKHVETHHV